MIIERILFAPRIPSLCFAEPDAVDSGVPDAVEVDPLEAALAEEEPQEPDDSDEAELEIGPEKVKVKKSVKEAWDGLQKTVQQRIEETKAEKAATAAERARVSEFQRHFEAISEEMAEIKAIDKHMEPYLKLTPQDWMAWVEQDADAARKAQTGLQAYQMQRQQLMSAAQGKVSALKESEAKAKAENQAKADAELAKQIKDWSPAKRQELVSRAVKEAGFSAEEVEPFTYDYRAVSLIEDALAHRALKARVAAKNNTPAPQLTQPQPKPPSNRGGGTNSLSDNIPMEQWAKNFRKSMRG